MKKVLHRILMIAAIVIVVAVFGLLIYAGTNGGTESGNVGPGVRWTMVILSFLGMACILGSSLTREKAEAGDGKPARNKKIQQPVMNGCCQREG